VFLFLIRYRLGIAGLDTGLVDALEPPSILQSEAKATAPACFASTAQDRIADPHRVITQETH